VAVSQQEWAPLHRVPTAPQLHALPLSPQPAGSACRQYRWMAAPGTVATCKCGLPTQASRRAYFRGAWTSRTQCIQSAVAQGVRPALSSHTRRSLSLQIPLAKMILAKKPLECLILVFFLDLVCCVLTPVKWVMGLPHLHAPPGGPPPPPYPSAPLYSTLQFCSTQAGLNATAFTPGSDGDVIYVSETYCFEQIVYNLPRDAVLVAHALYVNGTLTNVAAGTSALLITPSLLSSAPAAVRFEFTFPAAGVFVLDSASVFQLSVGGNVSSSSASGGRSKPRNSPSREASPPASAALQSTVSMTQLAEFDISQANLAVLKAAAPGSSVLGAALASKQVMVVAATAPLSKRPPMSFATFKRAQR
jgi:hypothetical protein